MPSFSSIPGPIVWVNNTIQERRRESLPITPAKSGNPMGRQSNATHTPRGTMPQRRAKTKPFSCVTRLAPDRSQSLVCCPTVNPTVPYPLDSLVHPHPAKKTLATQPCAPIPISKITLQRKYGLVTRKEYRVQASLLLEKFRCPTQPTHAQDSLRTLC